MPRKANIGSARNRKGLLGVLALVCLAPFAAASAQDLTQWNPEGPLFDGADSSPLYMPNGQIRLYYAPGSLALNNSIGGIISAVTSDGRTFTQDPGIRISFSDGNPAEMRVYALANGQYRMFYSTSNGGTNGGIGSALSSDGLNFTPEAGLRIAATITGQQSLEPDGNAVVSLRGGGYRMYFGLNFNPNNNNGLGTEGIYSATSPDMLNWTLDPGVRVGYGSALGGSAKHPFPLLNGDGSVTLFYWDDLIPTGIVATPHTTGVKFATSSDGLTFASETLTSISGLQLCSPCGDPSVYPLPNGGLRMYYNNFDPTTGITTLSSATSVELAPGVPALVSSVLPASRSVEVGAIATAFATIINAGLGQGLSCAIQPATSFTGNFAYQTTNPATNALTGTANTPVNIAAGAAQSFVFALSPSAAFSPAAVQLSFMCSNGAPAPTDTGLNTLLFSASTTPVPDIVALAASGDPGYVDIPGATGAGAFAVATVNLGADATITASANTGSATLPLMLSVCETNPVTGACLTAPTASVATDIQPNATPTFAIFAIGSGTIADSPGSNRVFIQFTDPGGAIRGSTSVAVRTQ